jgi:hypothetical protein
LHLYDLPSNSTTNSLPISPSSCFFFFLFTCYPTSANCKTERERDKENGLAPECCAVPHAFAWHAIFPTPNVYSTSVPHLTCCVLKIKKKIITFNKEKQQTQENQFKIRAVDLSHYELGYICSNHCTKNQGSNEHFG